jgi:hypothetical protein
MDKVEYVILDLTPVPHIDSMGCHFLEELNDVSHVHCIHHTGAQAHSTLTQSLKPSVAVGEGLHRSPLFQDLVEGR